MKKFPFIIALLLFAGMMMPADMQAQVMVRTKHIAPGVTLVKTKPLKPGRNFVWVDGYWNRNTYVPGYWAKRRKVKRVKTHRQHHRHCH